MRLKIIHLTMVFAMSAVLAACSSAPVLISKSAGSPSGIDFSGNWKLRGGASGATLPGARDRLQPIVRGSRVATRRDRNNVPVRVFLETGDNLKFTHTRYGIFISYDRSVVEEYTFGENRTIEIGPIEALRVSGWEGNTFVVETLDHERNLLIERWRLRAEDDVLERQVVILENDKETFNTWQLFDRV